VDADVSLFPVKEFLVIENLKIWSFSGKRSFTKYGRNASRPK